MPVGLGTSRASQLAATPFAAALAFRPGAYIGASIADAAGDPVLRKPDDIKSVKYVYIVGKAKRRPTYILKPADDGKTLTGAADVVFANGRKQTFQYQPAPVTYAPPRFTETPPALEYELATGVKRYNLAAISSGDGVAYRIDGKCPGIKVSGADLVIDTGTTGELMPGEVPVIVENSGGFDRTVLQVNIAAEPRAPDGFKDWHIARNGEAWEICFECLPCNGGSAITHVDYRINGGPWRCVGMPDGRFPIFAPEGEFNAEIRARNAVCPGPSGGVQFAGEAA